MNKKILQQLIPSQIPDRFKSNPDSCHTSFKFKTEEQLNQDFAILKKKSKKRKKEYT